MLDHAENYPHVKILVLHAKNFMAYGNMRTGDANFFFVDFGMEH